MIYRILLLFTAANIMLQPGSIAQEVRAGFTTTPLSVVEGMLDFAGAGVGDYLIDLGSGDGRFVIAAAQRGALGHGVEIDPELIGKSFENAISAGVEDQVHFLKEDLFTTDITAATIITLYLLESMNIDLKPEFLSQLEPGSTIVSHRYKMGAWEHDYEKEIDFRKIYKWIVPADFSGTWSWNDNGREIRISLAQKFQTITGIEIQSSDGTAAYETESAQIRGKSLIIIASDPDSGVAFTFYGKLKDDTLQGMIHAGSGPEKNIRLWSASRVHDSM